MKQLFFLFLLATICNSLYATIRTVSNNPSTIAQFNTIQAAVNAANSGDSIYVHGSSTAYAGFTITSKQLVILGPGWSPDKNVPVVATVNGITINGTLSSNTEIHGLTIISTIAINSSHPDNIRFIRNNFFNLSIQMGEGSTTYTGYLFEGNMFNNSSVDATSASTYQNLLFQNNYFYENATVRDGNIAGFFNCVNVLFNHNLWFGPGSGARNVCSGNSSRFLSFTNNIFVRRDAGSNIASSTYTNNITFNAGNNTPWAVNSNTDAGFNVANQDPQMVDQASVNAGTNNPLLDFTIAAGPANDSGSDGKDMGLLYDVTGSLNWANSRNSRLPRIFSMNVVNPTVAAGGTLSVTVVAKTSN